MLRKLVTVACVAALLLPAATSLAADEQETQEQLDDVQRRLEEGKDSVGDIDRRRTVTLGDLERIDGEIAVLDENLAAMRAELESAEGDLRAAEQRLATTTTTLVATEQRLADTRARLQDERAVFAGRTRASFMHGGATSLVGLTLDAGDIARFGRAVGYVERVMASDRDRVTRIEGLARQIAADTVELGALRSKQTELRQAAETERDRVAGLVQREEDLLDAAEGERHKRQLVLAELDADRATHLQMVAQLEEEGRQLEEELRRLAEEERRRQEEEERRLAEERRQEEQRQRQLASRSSSGGGGGGPASAAASSTGRMQRPGGGRVTSSYGWRTHPIFGTRRFHAGVDFGGGYGAPILAADGGVVVSASSRGGYGLAVVIDHGRGLTTLYAHQSRFAVSTGQRVSRGQVVGYVGSTGFSTGPHLHFEVRVGGATRDPMDYL
jgi:murein DD-endopeptidase MepM/ murein hydrolase activator NlpD